MFYLFFQTWIWILAAGLLGLLVGWLIWGRRDTANSVTADPAELTRLERELADCRSRCQSLEAAVNEAPVAAMAQAPEPETSTTESSTAVADADVDADHGEKESSDTTDASEISEQWRPQGLSEARDGGADDLKRIRGIGPVIERTLNELGIFHFDQIAAFDDDNIRWVDNYIAFPGRILREEWVSQAAELAGGGSTEFSNRYDKPKS